MKCLIVIAALVAVSAAGIVAPFGYSAGLPLPISSYSAISPLGYSTLSATPLLQPTFARTLVSAPVAPVVTPVVAPVVAAPVVAAPALAGVKSQYHAQDELGQASYGHAEPTQAHSAVQDAHGNKVGSFSYVAPDGRVLRTDYVADALGYRVESNALPVGPALPVVDTPEVVAARAAHLAAHARAKRALVTLPASTAPLVAPIAYHAPLQYAAPISTHFAAPIAAPLAAPLAYSALAAPTTLVRDATLTTVVNTPGHAVSYRVD